MPAGSRCAYQSHVRILCCDVCNCAISRLMEPVCVRLLAPLKSIKQIWMNHVVAYAEVREFQNS
jgi:hypothetical protein